MFPSLPKHCDHITARRSRSILSLQFAGALSGIAVSFSLSAWLLPFGMFPRVVSRTSGGTEPLS